MTINPAVHAKIMAYPAVWLDTGADLPHDILTILLGNALTYHVKE